MNMDDLIFKHVKMAQCPHCGEPYAIGYEGTVEGCDQCLDTQRNPVDHTVIEDDDPLTDMEQA